MAELETPRRDGGFTLVELLIVIVILGILATVSIFAVRGIRDRGQQATCEKDVRTLATAVESYFAQNAAATIPGADPESTLVAAELLVDESVLFSVDANGDIFVESADCGVVGAPA